MLGDWLRQRLQGPGPIPSTSSPPAVDPPPAAGPTPRPPVRAEPVLSNGRPFNLLFLSGHHRHTAEMAIRCHQIGIKLTIPPADSRHSFNHYVGPDLMAWLNMEHYGVHQYPTEAEMVQAVKEGEVDGLMVSLPQHLDLIRERFGDIPVAADHMVNRYEEYRSRGLRNFLTPSRRALPLMDAPNQALTVKVRDPAILDRVIQAHGTPVPERRGFYSYVHHLERRYPRGATMLAAINDRLDGSIDVRNFGRESPHGEVPDLQTMLRSRATLHVKDRNVCCNAVIDSMSVGIPVLVDDETVDLLGLEDYVVHLVSGIRFRDADEAAEWIRVLDRDDVFLAELSRRTLEFARAKCQDSAADVERFRQFIARMH